MTHTLKVRLQAFALLVFLDGGRTAWEHGSIEDLAGAAVLLSVPYWLGVFVGAYRGE